MNMDALELSESDRIVPVVGLGAGGHTKVVIDILRRMGRFDIVALLAPDPQEWEREVLGVKVRGGDELLATVWREGIRHAFVGLGQTERSTKRRRIFRDLVERGFEPVASIHPDATVAQSALLGRGATIMALASIGPQARIAENVIVNTGAIVEHECSVGAHAHVAPRACLGGGAAVGLGSHIGMGAVVLQARTVGDNCVIGAGAVVTRDVPDGCVAMGVPARITAQSPLVSG